MSRFEIPPAERARFWAQFKKHVQADRTFSKELRVSVLKLLGPIRAYREPIQLELFR
jgi:hypothetical protein